MAGGFGKDVRGGKTVRIDECLKKLHFLQTPFSFFKNFSVLSPIFPNKFFEDKTRCIPFTLGFSTNDLMPDLLQLYYMSADLFLLCYMSAR